MKIVKDLIRQNATMADVDKLCNDGAIPYRVWQQYRRLWIWSAVRFTDGGEVQEMFGRSHGELAVQIRIDRVRHICSRIE